MAKCVLHLTTSIPKLLDYLLLAQCTQCTIYVYGSTLCQGKIGKVHIHNQGDNETHT